MIKDQKNWNKWVDGNDDPYGKACINVAREVMRLLDTPEYEIFNALKIICDADKNVKAGGITGFMAACVAEMVSRCHSRGEEFRKAWNISCGQKPEEDKGGVINPAIMTVKTKE